MSRDVFRTDMIGPRVNLRERFLGRYLANYAAASVAYLFDTGTIVDAMGQPWNLRGLKITAVLLDLFAGRANFCSMSRARQICCLSPAQSAGICLVDSWTPVGVH